MRDIADGVASLGARMVVVGNGSPQQAQWFIEDANPPGDLYTDPSLKSYKLLGMRSGALTTMGPATVAHGIRAFGKGFRQTSTKGHPFQQGGVLIVMPDGAIPYRYISREAGDHPDPQDVLAALRSAVEEAP